MLGGVEKLAMVAGFREGREWGPQWALLES